MRHRQRRLLAWSPSAGSWRCSSGMVKSRRREASSNWPCHSATSNWCLASCSLHLMSLILSSRALSTQNPSQSREFVLISVLLTSLADLSQSCSIFPLVLQFPLDVVPPLHAEGVTFVLQAVQFVIIHRSRDSTLLRETEGRGSFVHQINGFVK